MLSHPKILIIIDCYLSFQLNWGLTMIPAYLWDKELEKRIKALEQRMKVIDHLEQRVKVLELKINKL